jgi:hypothetical protein
MRKVKVRDGAAGFPGPAAPGASSGTAPRSAATALCSVVMSFLYAGARPAARTGPFRRPDRRFDVGSGRAGVNGPGGVSGPVPARTGVP